MPSRATLLALICLLGMAAAETWRWHSAEPALSKTLDVATSASPGFTLVEKSVTTIPMPPGVPFAHASALAELPNGDLLACWWAGTRESAPDVRLYLARWRDGKWSPARASVDRWSLGEAMQRGVRRIGNPILWVAPDHRIHLYLVATGLGGWAASRVAHMVSDDGGETFEPMRMLPLSPLWNTSVLVRTRPVGLADGGWLMPAYFELGNKYPMVVSFDAHGDPRWVQRIGDSTTSLQPAFLPMHTNELRALMRDIGPQRRVQQAVSVDGGLNWRDLPATSLANHDNSVASLQLDGGGYVLLHNDAVPSGGWPRQWLRMSISVDGNTWVPGPDVRLGRPGDEFSYPSLLQIGQNLHVTYTQQRTTIAHHVYQIRYAQQGEGVE